MAARSPPAEPLVVVFGATGTGKSEVRLRPPGLPEACMGPRADRVRLKLAVELATRFRGEIINADAMQLYRGLPVLTNKMAETDRRGIPHHLLGHIGPLEPPWDVEDFKREASRLMADIRARGNLPIVVGGTHYYVDALLFPDVLLDDIEIDASRYYPVLDQPTPVLLEELRKCDPVMADRWHPNDRRKIRRSLEIFLHTGRPASELYAEQQKQRKDAAATGQNGPWENLLFWLHADREVLCERLDRRVDTMLHAGLVDEVRELSDLKRQRTALGLQVDVTKGIWQSIGYKQLEPYVRALDTAAAADDLAALQTSALDDVKAATRRYASHQTRWIRLKQMRHLREQGPSAVASLYLLDSSDAAAFAADVVEPAARLAELFVAGRPRPPAADVLTRACARAVLAAAVNPPPAKTPCRRACELCRTVLLTEQAWQRHLAGAGHRRVALRQRKLALAPLDPGRPDDGPPSPSLSSPRLASLSPAM